MGTPGQDKITGGIVVIGGIFIVYLLAGANNELGKILLIFMSGILLLWLMTGGYGFLAKWENKSGTTIGQHPVIAA